MNTLILLMSLPVFAQEWDPSPSERVDPAVATLPDGRVVLFGGLDPDGNPLGDTWVRDPDTAIWSRVEGGDAPAARLGHTMVTLPDGRVVAFGGQEASGDMFNDLHFFENNQWRAEVATGDPPTPRRDHVSWVPEGSDEVYVFGGVDAVGNTLRDIWRLTNELAWVQLPDAPVAWAAGGVGSSSLEAWFFGGDDSFRLFGYSGGSWGSASLPGGPGLHPQGATAQLGDKVYYLGGETSGASLVAGPSAWVFDADAFAWSALPDLPHPVSGAAAAALPDGTILLIGGEDDAGDVGGAWSFDPSAEAWSAVEVQIDDGSGGDDTGDSGLTGDGGKDCGCAGGPSGGSAALLLALAALRRRRVAQR
ncbi:MAG: hypothetical protein H6739_10470 [Alphaproteobacteria bacterium]|nr:hypothetical protein [Alphaproteobacteria bacterium]